MSSLTSKLMLFNFSRCTSAASLKVTALLYYHFHPPKSTPFLRIFLFFRKKSGPEKVIIGMWHLFGAVL